MNKSRHGLGLLLAVVMMVMVMMMMSVRSVHSFENCSCRTIPTITFGQTVSLTGSNGLNGILIRDGIRAAFKQFNDDPSLQKRFSVDLQVMDDMYDPITAATNVMAFTKDPNIFGVIGTLGASCAEKLAPVAIASGLPVVGVYGGPVLRKPFNRYVINYRASLFDESAAIVAFLVTQSKRRIALFAQTGALGAAALAGVSAALNSSNLYLHTLSYHTAIANTSLWTEESQTAINAMAHAKSKTTPDAVVVAAQYAPGSIFIQAVKAKWPHIFVACVSLVSSNVLVDSLREANASAPSFQNLFISQVVPVPTDTSIPLVVSYQTALKKLGITEFSFFGLEGYILGRLAIAALERIRGYSITQELFVAAVYEASYFNFDEFRIGPFYPATVDGGCNQGMHEVIITHVTPNKTVEQVDSLEFNTCGYTPKVWDTITFGMSCTFNGNQESLCQGFRDGVLAAFKLINDAGGIRGTTRLQLATKDDTGSNMKALLNNINFLEDDSIFGLIGTSPLSISQVIEEVNKTGKVLFGAFTGDNSLRRPFQRDIVNFRASVNDEVFAIVHYLYYNTKITKVAALYEATAFGTSQLLGLAFALQEKRWDVVSQSGFTSSNLTQSIDSLFAGPGADLEAVVFIGLENVIADVLVRVHAHSKKIKVFGLSNTVTVKLVNNSAINDKVNWENFFITSVVPDIADDSIEVVQEYITGIDSLDVPPQPSAAGLEGFIVGELLATALNRIMGKPLTVDNLLDALYENGNFNLFGLRCGPLFEVGSNTTTRASCNQCMKQVYLTLFRDVDGCNATSQPFSFEDSCMYAPSVSLDFQLTGMRMVMTTMAGICIGYTVIIMLLVIFYRNSPHVRATSYKFTLVSCIGGILCYVGIFIIYPVPTNTSCALEPWIADLAFVTLFGPIFAKTYRIDKIFNNKKIKHQVISDAQVFRIFTSLLAIFVGFQVVYTVVARPYMHEVITTSRTRFEECTMDSETFAYVDYVLKGILLIWGCFLCQRVYKISGQFARFNESKKLVVCIYHTTFLAMGMLLLGLATKDDPNLHFACVSSILLENTMVVVTLLYGHPVFRAMTNQALGDPNDESSNTSSHMTGLATSPKHSKVLAYAPIVKVAVGSTNNTSEHQSRSSLVQETAVKRGSATSSLTSVAIIHETEGVILPATTPVVQSTPVVQAVLTDMT